MHSHHQDSHSLSCEVLRDACRLLWQVFILAWTSIVVLGGTQLLLLADYSAASASWTTIALLIPVPLHLALLVLPPVVPVMILALARDRDAGKHTMALIAGTMIGIEVGGTLLNIHLASNDLLDLGDEPVFAFVANHAELLIGTMALLVLGIVILDTKTYVEGPAIAAISQAVALYAITRSAFGLGYALTPDNPALAYLALAVVPLGLAIGLMTTRLCRNDPIARVAPAVGTEPAP